MAKYKTTAKTTYYMTSGSVGGTKPDGFTFDSTTTMAIKNITCRNISGTKEWIPANVCVEVTTEPPPTDPPTEPPAENFSPPVEIMARWEIGKDSSGNPIYSDYYYYDIQP